MKLILTIIMIMASQHSSAQAIFKNFSNWDQASTYYMTELEPQLAGIENRENYSLLSHSNISYVRAEKVLKTIHTAFQELYPNQTKFKTPPFLIILDSDELNAFVPKELDSDEKPYLFVTHKDILLLSDDALIGLFAHELAHLYLQWEEKGESIPRSRYYTKSQQVQFGSNIKNDEALSKKVKIWEDLRSYTGPFINREFSGIPLHYSSSEVSPMREIVYLLVNAPNNTLCNETKDSRYDYEIFVMDNFFSYESLSLSLGNDLDKIEKLKKMTAELEKDLRDCLVGVKYDYKTLFSKVYGIDIEILNSLLEKMDEVQLTHIQEVESYYASMDTVLAITKLVKDFRERTRKIEEEINLNELRIYTHEDHADEITIEVLNKLNISQEGFNQFLIEATSDESCEYKSNPEPNYGPFEDPHHSSCWRAHRNYKYQLYLNKGK